MKWFLIAAVLVVLPSSVISAPADSLATASRPNSLRAGAWALQFDINGELVSISSFSGGVSLKRHFSPKSALRFGVGLNANGGTQTPDVEQPDIERSRDAYGVSMETVYQRYLNPDARVNAYWGVGPLVGFARSTEESSRDSLSTETRYTQWSAGALAMFGVEWFATRDFSLHAEYTGSASYFKREAEQTVTRVGGPNDYRKQEEDGWSVGESGDVRFGISVYF